MTALRFDDAAHVYTFEDGRQAVSVTRALKVVGYINDAYYTQFGRTRGTYVHQMLEWFDRGELDETTLDPQLWPYLDAYRTFLAETGATWDGIEVRLGDPARLIAGTLDRIGPFGLLDLKSGAFEPWHCIQTAMYALLAQTNGLILSARRVKRWGLYLTSDGRFDLRRHGDADELKVAEAVMTVAVDRVARTPRAQEAA